MWCATTVVAKATTPESVQTLRSAPTAASQGMLPRTVGRKIHPKSRVEHQKRQNQRQLPSQLPLPKGKEKVAEAKSKDVAEASFEKLKRVKNPKNLKSQEEVEPKGQKAMVVKTATAVKTGSDAGGPKGATGTSSTERPVTHHLSSTLQEFVGSVGIGDPKTCWLVDSGATCHIVSEKWVKHYTVSFEYQGPRPSLKGAGDNDLPVKGV